MMKRELQVGEILQLRPDTTRNRMFAACLCVVDEPKAFGAQVYVQGLGENGEPAGQAYYRASWEELDETGGRAPWMPGGSEAAGGASAKD